MKNNKFINGIHVFLTIAIIIVSLLGIGYAYFNISISEIEEKPINLKVISTLATNESILEPELSIIHGEDYLTKAEKVEFNITNTEESDVGAKYIIKMVDVSISKNLSSKYFKYAIVIKGTNNKTVTGNFLDNNIASEGTNDKEVINGVTKQLIQDNEALMLDINKTDNVVFYMWLEKDDNISQVYLTGGTFNGKLAVEAFPAENEN